MPQSMQGALFTLLMYFRLVDWFPGVAFLTPRLRLDAVLLALIAPLHLPEPLIFVGPHIEQMAVRKFMSLFFITCLGILPSFPSTR